jgi:glycosyltransferase involved in cell wall biosynthesis
MKNHQWEKVVDSGRPADVGLLLEGTYPFVSGGVSSWVHQIINGFPQLTFSLIFLGGAREHYGEYKYPLPANVVHLEMHYLMEKPSLSKPRPKRGRKDLVSHIAELHESLRRLHGGDLTDLLMVLVREMGRPKGIDLETFLRSRPSWALISDSYTRYCTEPSFVNYFWTVRIMHMPLFRLAAMAAAIPPVKALHSISTGYAGFLAMLLKYQRDLPFILSEHGIYTKERKIDLARADWIDDPREAFGSTLDADVSYIRRLWIRFFEGIGRLAYQAADPIVSLYEGNRNRQIQDGADPSRTRVIPNGIDLDRFAPLRSQRPPGVPPVLALIGRVVPIKDIKTFIRAMRTICNTLPEAQGWLVGPEDEDPAYAGECRALVRNLDLEENVKFLGFQKVEDIFRQIGLLVLTSISEALPLVILEGYASGVPAVATDVGACRELIEGGRPEDQALGRSGAVVPIANPEATARAALPLLQDEDAWRAAQQAAIRRVETYYTQSGMFDQYRILYRRGLSPLEEAC